jgi:predicted RNA-binding protein with PIN domain
MQYIIDGYNLLKTDPELMMLQRFGLEAAREALIKRVGSAAGLRAASQVTIVFDGHQSGNATETVQRQGRIIIVFSKLGETADDVIKRMVRQSATPSDIRIITRDWEIKDVTRAAGAASTMLTRRLPPKPKKSFGKDSDDEASGWDNTTRKRGPSKRLPKNQRKSKPTDDVYW